MCCCDYMWKGPNGTRGAAGRRLRRPLGSRRRLPPQASRYIPGSSALAPKATFGSVPCACVLVSSLFYKPSVKEIKNCRIESACYPPLNYSRVNPNSFCNSNTRVKSDYPLSANVMLLRLHVERDAELPCRRCVLSTT